MNTEPQVTSESLEQTVMTDPFLKTLAGIVRAEDSYGTWDKKPNHALLREFVVTKEERKSLPIIGDPDPEVLQRVEQFYRAIGLRIEARTGFMSSPMIKMSHEGFGRVLLTTGKLVVFSKTLRDVHRFGFESLAVLGKEGEKVVTQAVETIEAYPSLADA